MRSKDPAVTVSGNSAGQSTSDSDVSHPVHRDLHSRRLLLLAVCVALLLLARWNNGLWRWNLEDLAVYRHAGAALDHGHAIYASGTNQLPFTYPPFAAVLFAGFAAIGSVAAAVVLTTLSLGSYLAIVKISCEQERFARATASIGIVLLAAEPVIRTLRLGQINLILTALVVLDCLVIPSRYRGLITGVAAGIKLTPGVFIIYFLLHRDWRAALRCALGLGASIGLSAVFAPADTWKFWTKLFYNPDHIGGIAYVDNQSLVGVLVRLTRDEHPPFALAGVVELLALALAGWAAHRQLARGETLAALTCIGIGGLLASPISWSHHWIWLLPALIVLVKRRRYVTAGAVAAVTYLAPHWFTPAGGLKEFHQSWWQGALCATMAAAGVLVLLSLASCRGVETAASELSA